MFCYHDDKGGLIMKQNRAAEGVLHSIGSDLSSARAVNVKEDGDFYYVSFRVDFLFYEAYVEKRTGNICGICAEPSPVSPLSQWDERFYS